MLSLTSMVENFNLFWDSPWQIVEVDVWIRRWSWGPPHYRTMTLRDPSSSAHTEGAQICITTERPASGWSTLAFLEMARWWYNGAQTISRQYNSIVNPALPWTNSVLTKGSGCSSREATYSSRISSTVGEAGNTTKCFCLAKETQCHIYHEAYD